MLDIVAVFPLLPREVVKLGEERKHPSATGLSAVDLVVVLLLKALPARRRKALKEVLPSDGVLLPNSLFDVVGPAAEVDGEAVAPLGDGVDNGISDVWVGIVFIEGGGKGCKRGFIDVIGLMPSALLDMRGVFIGVVTAGADCICLVFPFNESRADSTILTSILGYPFATAMREFVHELGGRCPVDMGCCRESIMSRPPCLGWFCLNYIVESVGIRVGDF